MWKSAIAYAQDTAAGAGDAAGAGEAGQAAPSVMNPMLFMIAIFAIMWFLMIRPNQKRDKERREMLGALAKGDEVVTNGGMCGTIVGISDKKVVLKVSDSPVTKIEFLRGAVSQILKSDAADEDEKS